MPACRATHTVSTEVTAPLPHPRQIPKSGQIWTNLDKSGQIWTNLDAPAPRIPRNACTGVPCHTHGLAFRDVHLVSTDCIESMMLPARAPRHPHRFDGGVAAPLVGA
eukprot:1186259-Prorocentrum_minimum.AAC.1